MRILVGIPVIAHADLCKAAIDSVVLESDVLVIDNNADPETKLMLLREDIEVLVNTENIYVNAAWSEIMQYFLLSEFYDTLIIMNSDLIMQPGWSAKLQEGQICIPTDGSHAENVVVTEGIPGVFIHLSREMVEMVYPIPSYVKIWFGDNWVFEILRRLGYQTVVKAGLVGLHYNGGSQSVNIVPDKEAIIEVDKVAWAEFGERDIEERVAKWRK